ncbi:MAG: NEW3 domain-containing protein [Candidatus Nanohaloarchaea archaeon]
MGKKTLIVLTGVLLFTGLAASQTYTQSFDLYLNEEASLGDYRFEFSDATGDQRLKVGEKRDDSVHILHSLESDNIYSSVGEKMNVTEGLNFTLEEIDADDEGLFLSILVDSENQIFASSELESDAPSKVYIAKGETLSLNLELENTGIIDEDYNLSTDSRDLEASFGYQGFNVTSVEVGSGESVSISAEIEVPESAEVGTRNLSLIAEDESRAEETVVLDVRGVKNPDPEINQDIQETFVRTSSGETVNIPVRVSNRESGTGIRDGSDAPGLTDVRLDVEAPEDWESEVTPQVVDSMEGYDSERFVVELRPPEGVEPGDHFVDIQAVSSEVEAETGQVRVNVYEQSMMRYVGIVIMVLSIGSLIAVYRRFGRR